MERGVGLGGGHHVAVYAPVGKSFFARVVFRLIAHAGPCIGGYKVSACAGLGSHRVRSFSIISSWRAAYSPSELVPRCSRGVKMSANIWLGWNSLVKPLITDTREHFGSTVVAGWRQSR